MASESTLFPVKKTLRVRGRLLDLEGGAVMGIINVTPDSFFAESRQQELTSSLKQAEKMLAEGALFLDIGGYSSRPGAADVPEEEEKKRVLPVIEAICKEFPEANLSIDTFRSGVAQKALDVGADIINDISGGELDTDMFALAAKAQVPYIMMHMQGTPATMQADPQYENVVKEVLQFFSFRLEKLRALGVHDVILDPGFAFGKTLEHNFQLLKRLPLFGMLEQPILVGVSRKSMINRILKTKPEEALNGTTAVHTLAALNGADILRAHDVKEAVEVLKIVKYYRETL